MKTLSLNIPVYTESEFLDIVLRELRVDPMTLIEKGFPKWDKNNAQLFIRSIFLSGCDSLPHQYFIDIGDHEYCWLVSVADAIMFKVSNA